MLPSMLPLLASQAYLTFSILISLVVMSRRKILFVPLNSELKIKNLLEHTRNRAFA